MYQFSEVDPETKQAFKVDLLWKWLPAFSYQLFLQQTPSYMFDWALRPSLALFQYSLVCDTIVKILISVLSK